MKENRRHSHKPSQIPTQPNAHGRKAFATEQNQRTIVERAAAEGGETVTKSFEFQTRNQPEPLELDSEANISFQQTAPRIAFPSPQSFQVKRSYLDQIDVGPVLREKDININEGSEAAASPTSQFGPCSRRCTLVANENVEFYKHLAHNSGTAERGSDTVEDFVPVVTEKMEGSGKVKQPVTVCAKTEVHA